MNVGSLNTIIFNEFYHVGKHGSKTDFALDNHKNRLDLKQKALSGKFKSPDAALSGRKSNFYRNLISGISSHMGKISRDREKDPKRYNKRVSILGKRLTDRGVSGSVETNSYGGINTKDIDIENGILSSDLDQSAYGQLLKKISKETNIDIEGGVGGKSGSLNIYGFEKKITDPSVNLDKSLSDETKKELLKFEKDLRMSRRYHKRGSKEITSPSSEDQAESIASTVNTTPEQQKQTKEIATMTENIKKQAEKAPKSWIGQKIRALRDLYSEWLEKKNKDYDAGKNIGFFNGILRIIANCIDWLLGKLQNFAG